ncbi:ABC transporter substrate-binding protein [Photobacterium lipolyticum]|uniref:Iron ABC transporter substrate-binding protein n=1 Tax=Photobacterium lipolyticum TaxID=266810 RepID=A0A2T3N2K6_9GAMM|nr:ABC transporter substrate-binding protein [Photobacterium lipolyticum]PSW06596.1 iron ABC transporter substrate-binding protein [Photobacterium lipolyticum]
MFRLLLTLIALAFVPSSYAYERIVLLAPAAGDILIKLGAQDKVVGVTRNNHDFPEALQVGSHIKPNIELLKGLDPDLLIISSNRFFSQQMTELIKAETIIYDPLNLDEILQQVARFGGVVDKQSEATQLINELTDIRKQIKPLQDKPSVVFEVTESPFIIAGQRSIVNGIIEEAGGKLFAPSDRKIAKYNVESVLYSNPEYYIYQVGPMNKRPTPPLERPNYKILSSKVIKVDQLRFSRATTESFKFALELNQKFRL